MTADDIVGQCHKGDYRYGAVVESYSDEEDTGPENGTIQVEWYPHGVSSMNIKPLDVDVLDRALLPRDVVFNNQEQLGTILDVQKKGDFVIVGTDKKLKDIDVNDLHFYSEFIGGQPVCIGPWIGQVISVDRMVYLKTACGARACVPEHLLNVISLIEDPYPHPSDKSEFELQGAAASIFYPGQTLIMLSRAAPFLTWSKKDELGEKQDSFCCAVGRCCGCQGALAAILRFLIWGRQLRLLVAQTKRYSRQTSFQ